MLTNCSTPLWICCWSHKAFQIFQISKISYCLFFYAFCLSIVYLVHCSVFTVIWHVYYVTYALVIVVVDDFFCFLLLQTDFKMLNSQAANITFHFISFHLKQNTNTFILHSFLFIIIYIYIRMCVLLHADDVFSFSLFLLKFLFCEQCVFLLLCIVYLLSPYNSHTVHTQKNTMYLK